MRILYFADIRFPLERANGVQTMETCHALAARGHEVRLLVRPDSHRPPRDPFAYYGLDPLPAMHVETATHTAGGIVRRRAGYVASAMARALQRKRVDVVITRDLGLANLLLSLPARLRPPLVYESHGYAPEVASDMRDRLGRGPAASRRKLARLAARERCVWRGAEGYITITHALAHELRGRFGVRPRLAVVADGVRLSSERTFVAPELHCPPVVAYVGHLYPWKGVDVLVEALALLPDAQGLIIGGIEQEPDLERVRALAASLAPGRVSFTGHIVRPRVAGHIAAADVLVLPNTATRISTAYTSPLKLFEYMAAGRPIVASDLPAIREVLTDGKQALLVPAGNAAALAAGIRRLLDDWPLAVRLAKAAFDDAATYGWDARAARIEGLLKAVA